MQPTRVSLGLLTACALTATACGGGGRNDDAGLPGPGFAVDGSVETYYNIHIYRATLPPSSERGLVIQFHPRGAAFRLQDDIPLDVDGLVVCDHGVGGPSAGRVRGSCRKVAVGGEFKVGGGAAAHVGVELLAPGDEEVFIEEVVVGYDPADAFLAVDYPSQ